MTTTRLIFSSFDVESWIYSDEVVRVAKKNLDRIADSLSKQSRFFRWEKEVVFRCQRELQKHGINPCFDVCGAESKFTLTHTLMEGDGNCLGLTTLYIAIGEILNLPFCPVLYEGHVAVVLMKSLPFFFDPTHSNAPVCTEWAYKLKTDRHQILTTGEFVAVHLSNQSKIFFLRHGLMDDAVFLIDSALELFPDYTAGWINRAALMKKLDNTKEMRRSLDKAKSLNPGCRYTKAITQIEGEKHE